jgi:hypothetical protein
MTPAEGRRQRAALMRDIARELKRKNRDKLLALRSRVRASRAEARAALREAIAHCRAGRKLPTLSQLAADLRAAKRAARSQCAVDIKAARSLKDGAARARAELDAEQTYQRDLRRIEAANRRKMLAQKRRGAPRAGAQETDEQVEGNLPPELVALWRRVRRQIRASDRKSRTEAFLQYAEEHPSEEWAALEDSVDRAVAEMERRQAMPQSNPKKKKKKGKRSPKKNAPRLTRAQSKRRFAELKKAGCKPKRVRLPSGESVVVRRKACAAPPMRNPRRPPKRWFDRCLASVQAHRYAADPAAVCGAAWWRMPAHQRAAIVRRWERGSARQRRVAIAVAKAERNRVDRARKKKTPR